MSAWLRELRCLERELEDQVGLTLWLTPKQAQEMLAVMEVALLVGRVKPAFGKHQLDRLFLVPPLLLDRSEQVKRLRAIEGRLFVERREVCQRKGMSLGDLAAP